MPWSTFAFRRAPSHRVQLSSSRTEPRSRSSRDESPGGARHSIRDSARASGLGVFSRELPSSGATTRRSESASCAGVASPAVTFRSVPSGWQVTESTLIAGSVVISVDYFKRFLAGLRAIFGGRIKSYESLLDRARREALMRIKQKGRRAGLSRHHQRPSRNLPVGQFSKF